MYLSAANVIILYNGVFYFFVILRISRNFWMQIKALRILVDLKSWVRRESPWMLLKSLIAKHFSYLLWVLYISKFWNLSQIEWSIFSSENIWSCFNPLQTVWTHWSPDEKSLFIQNETEQSTRLIRPGVGYRCDFLWAKELWKIFNIVGPKLCNCSIVGS